jgi:hypothetical protein
MKPRITVVFDVRSPWCYQTSRWLRRLAELGEVVLDWGVFSLEVVNLHADEDPEAYPAEYGPALRVARVLRENHGQEAIGRFYAAIGGLMWEAPAPAEALPGHRGPSVTELSRRAVAAIGLDPALVDETTADPATWTAVLDEHRRWVDEFHVFGVPTMIIDGVAHFGPVLRSLPDDETTVQLWRHVHGVIGYSTIFELKRFKARSERADLPGAVWRANVRVSDMRRARELMVPGGPHETASLEWAMATVRAEAGP